MVGPKSKEPSPIPTPLLKPSPLLLTPKRLTPRLPPIVFERSRSSLGTPPPSPEPWSWYHRHCHHGPRLQTQPRHRQKYTRKNSRTRKYPDAFQKVHAFLEGNDHVLDNYINDHVAADRLEDWLRKKCSNGTSSDDSFESLRSSRRQYGTSSSTSLDKSSTSSPRQNDTWSTTPIDKSPAASLRLCSYAGSTLYIKSSTSSQRSSSVNKSAGSSRHYGFDPHSSLGINPMPRSSRLNQASPDTSQEFSSKSVSSSSKGNHVRLEVLPERTNGPAKFELCTKYKVKQHQLDSSDSEEDVPDEMGNTIPDVIIIPSIQQVKKETTILINGQKPEVRCLPPPKMELPTYTMTVSSQWSPESPLSSGPPMKWPTWSSTNSVNRSMPSSVVTSLEPPVVHQKLPASRMAKDGVRKLRQLPREINVVERRRACSSSCVQRRQLHLVKPVLDEDKKDITSMIEEIVLRMFPDILVEMYLIDLQNALFCIAKQSLEYTTSQHERIIRRVVVDERPWFLNRHDLSRLSNPPKHVVVYFNESQISAFLLQVAQAVFEEMISLDQLIKKILEVAQHLVSADRASLFLVDHTNSELVSTVFDLRYEANKDSEFFKEEIRIPINKGIAGHVAMSGETLNIPDAYLDERFNKSVDEATGYHTISILCMPIKVRGKVLAVVQMVNKRDKNVFGSDDESAFQVFSTFFGLALHHAKLYDKIKRKEQKYKVALEVLGYHNTCYEEDVVKILEERVKGGNINYNDFALNPFEISDVEKCKGILTMFEDLFDMTRFDLTVLTRFVLTVKKNYRRVPYHNFDHGWAVANSMYVMLKTDTDNRFDFNYRLSLFVASLCHDLDHRGYTNKFMSEIDSPLAAIYTTSTLEHHHFNMTVTILQQDGHNIFYQMSSGEYKDVLDSIRQCILATDLAAFFPNLKKINELVFETPQFDWDDVDHRKIFGMCLMTGADLSASAKPFTTQLRTVDIIFTEFYQQGDMELRAGRAPVPMMDRRCENQLPACQVGFLTSVCQPCYRVLATLFPDTKPMLEMVNANLKEWHLRAKEATEKE